MELKPFENSKLEARGLKLEAPSYNLEPGKASVVVRVEVDDGT